VYVFVCVCVCVCVCGGGSRVWRNILSTSEFVVSKTLNERHNVN